MEVRSAKVSDLPEITSIFNHYIQTSVSTFRLTAVDLTTIEDTYRSILAQNLPYLVVKEPSSSQVLGYAYATGYRMPSHAGYAHTAEISIFVHPSSRTSGVGKLLMDRLISDLGDTNVPITEVLAIMAVDPDRLGLEEWYGRWGFVQVGRLRNVGRKFGKWLDTLFLQLSLEQKKTEDGNI
ncbi:acyl-CoA N-acyltransferase [Mycena floridula]|nr:acyl-CoA N-acyltransferase [Mycena floridula]